jgi:hypothetical protein
MNRRIPVFPLTALLVIGATLTGACARKVDIETEKAAVEQAVRASIMWAMEKDQDLLYRVMAHDEDFFIFHPDSASTITSWSQFERLTEEVFMSPSFRAVRTELRDLHIGISRLGDAAWFRTWLDDIGEWDGQEAGWLNVRWTGALEKRAGGWRIVQMHFSFPEDRFQPQG